MNAVDPAIALVAYQQFGDLPLCRATTAGRREANIATRAEGAEPRESRGLGFGRSPTDQARVLAIHDS
jgi:hypothetical protein